MRTTTKPRRAAMRKSTRNRPRVYAYPLLSLPDDMLTSILQKMPSFESLCQMRKANKQLDSVAVQNQSSIRAEVSPDYRLNICHCITNETTDYLSITFSHYKCKEVKLDQVTSAHFQQATIMFKTHLRGYKVKRRKITPEIDINLYPFSCETLTIKEGNEKYLGIWCHEMLPRLRVQELVFECEVSFGFLENPVVQNFKKAYFYRIKDFVGNTQVVGNIQIRRIKLHNMNYDLTDGFVTKRIQPKRKRV